MNSLKASYQGLALAASAGQAHAFSWAEGQDGDLSGDVNAPTVLSPLVAGDNSISGTMGGGDFDLLTFSVASGQSIVALMVDNWVGPPEVSFVGVAEGTLWPDGLGFGVTGAQLIRAELFNADSIGTNLLFAPLGPGDYAVLVQDTDEANSYEYGLSFVATVPVPAAAWLFGSALGLLGWLRRRAADAA